MEQDELLKKGWSLTEIYEILRDCMSFEFILEIKRRMKDTEAKGYVSAFLKTMAPLLVYELANSLEILGIKSKKEFFNPGMAKKVRDERQKICHKVIMKSSLSSEIQEKMGLNFNEKVYDMNIIVSTYGNELLDMNYEMYIDMENIAEEFDFWDSLFGIPRVIADTIFSALKFDFSMSSFFTVIDDIINDILKIIELDMKCQRYSYSVHKLFSKSPQLSMKDKVFILYRYHLIASVEHLEKIIPNLTMDQDGKCIMDLKMFLKKYKAIIICLIGDELKSLESELGVAIKNDIEMKIPEKSFWRINRKLRNNIHYSEVIIMSDDEMKIVDRCQNVYINIIKEHMCEKLYIDTDKECLTMTGFLKEILEKRILQEELDKHYVSYYLQYVKQGKL